jgi:hypothetical protein
MTSICELKLVDPGKFEGPTNAQLEALKLLATRLTFLRDSTKSLYDWFTIGNQLLKIRAAIRSIN